MDEILKNWLESTTIEMDIQPLYGTFHIITASLMIFLAAISAWALRRRSERARVCILTTAGWFLIIIEIYKQLFYYYIVNDGHYDYWFLPFQLCSVPMYLCVLLPFVSGKIRSVFMTFMLGFTFTSAVAAFIYPADMLRPWLTLTAHGFIWHGVLMFISLVIGFSKMADLSKKGYLRSVVLFLILCAAAIVINIVAEPLALAGAAEGGPVTYPSMFYLSPYHISVQPGVGKIQEALGIPAGLLIYICAVCAAALIVDAAFFFFGRKAVKRSLSDTFH